VLVVVTTTSLFADAEAINAGLAAEDIFTQSLVLKVEGYEYPGISVGGTVSVSGFTPAAINVDGQTAL
jgi:hypothetical protein